MVPGLFTAQRKHGHVLSVWLLPGAAAGSGMLGDAPSTAHLLSCLPTQRDPKLTATLVHPPAAPAVLPPRAAFLPSTET